MKYVFFDMGKTLINFQNMDENTLVDSIKDTVTYLNDQYKITVSYEDFKDYYDQWQGKVKEYEKQGKEYDIENLLIPFIQSYGVTIDSNDCINIYKKLYDRVINLAVLEKDADQLLKEMKSRNIPIGVISNMPIYSEITKEIFKKLDIDKYIDYYLFSYDIKICKPNVKIFQKALLDNQLLPNESIMIGDSIKNDYLPAKFLGMHAIVYKNISSSNEINDYKKLAKDFKDGKLL